MSAKKPPARVAFLDPKKIDEAICEMVNVARLRGNRLALAGGCAMQMYGSDRFTADVDFIADDDLGVRKTGRLTFGGVSCKASNGTPVDLIIRDDDYANLYTDALEAAREMTTSSGVKVDVVTLPWLAAMKLVSGRGKDLQDLAFILFDSGASYKEIRSVVKSALGPFGADELDSAKNLIKLERDVERKKGNRR